MESDLALGGVESGDPGPSLDRPRGLDCHERPGQDLEAAGGWSVCRYRRHRGEELVKESASVSADDKEAKLPKFVRVVAYWLLKRKRLRLR